MHTQSKIVETSDATTVAAQVAGEDIKLGDFVSVLNEVFELPSFLWSCSGAVLSADEPVRSRYMPCEAGQPCKVKAVCLPFVYARRVHGSMVTFDLRRHQLVRLDPKMSKSVWKLMRGKKTKKKRKKK